ncbi:MAG: pyridine nucleotide-disulfide oxidoreductase [Gammaproteobacteria bacterium]|nr:pyridine nucleotide-disulfide oxidoreductase [Gammaproteobacteria bacterium]
MFARLRTLLQFDILFFIFAFYLITKGIIRREDSFLTAESGLGYMLGIVGASMMLLLLLYPLRKHVKLLQHFGAVRYWFRFHMLLGVAGPVLILYHSNFGLGSTNSNIALFSMLVVAGSGLFGRLFYSKIHDGLYGRKIELAELQKSLQEIKSEMSGASAVTELISSFEKRALHGRSLISAVVFMPLSRLYANIIRRQLLANMKRQSISQKALLEMDKNIHRYFRLIIKVADFSVYERLFSLWHVLHIPLFIMMIISGIVHVFAVHVY